MSDIVLFWVIVVGAVMVISAIVVGFAVMSNSQHNVETLREANERLMEMRKEYGCGKEDER